MTQKPKPNINQISDWLTSKYTAPITDLEPISGGFWSSAYTFMVDGAANVLRFSDLAEGFASDVAAMQFTSPALPIPEVTEVGETLGHHYAISRRHYGHFLEDVSVADADAAGGALERLLTGLRAVPSTPTDAVMWYEPDSSITTWHGWLRAGLIDNPDSLVSGWRKTLAKDARLNAIYSACEARIEELLPHCPERRDLVHGDLLHQNVLISDDATRVTAIFSWKCSMRGDFLFDVAWCTVWSPWHAGIAATNLWQRTLNAPDLSKSDLHDAALRHHCYELQIAASHFGWTIWTNNDEDLALVAARAEEVLNRGPLPI